jgi:hypothetical protein
MDETKPKRRFRFGLRTLLLVVMLAAMGSWAYWIGWPMWMKGREQLAFERSARQLKAGMTLDEAYNILVPNEWWQGLPKASFYDSSGNRFVGTWIVWPNAIYCICIVLPNVTLQDSDYGWPSTSIEVFRLPLPPAGYQAQTRMGQLTEAMGRTRQRPSDAVQPYMHDFLQMISGDRKNKMGFRYELIFSNPPAKPNQ